MAKADYEHLYWTRRWRRRSAWQLREHPLCAMCLSRAVVTAASVCDHITPHHGNEHAFWFGAVQSLCVPCHNVRKQGIEVRGFDTTVDPVTGLPLDPKHPWFTGRLPTS